MRGTSALHVPGAAALLCTTVLITAFSVVAATELEPMLDARRAVEEVYWQHTVWPEQNRDPKPDLATVLPDELLRQRVDDTLRLLSLLERRWQHPVTAVELQAELDRMVAETAWPEMLDELFRAAGYEPRRVVDGLVLPLLAERLARRYFAADAAIHGRDRARAEAAVAACSGIDDLARAAPAYREEEWLRYGDTRSKREAMDASHGGRALLLGSADWLELTADLDRRLADTPLGAVGPLTANAESYAVTAVLERSDDRIRLVTASWPRRDFDAWWQAVRDRFPAATPPAAGGVELPLVEKRAIAANSWSATSSTGAPGARAGHSAVWTGSLMLIWGGRDSQGGYWGGNRYDPATNAWSAMNSTGHPDAAAYHTAVWTGTYMVVWGGWFGSPVNTGGRYNPTTNGWAGVTTTGAPSARQDHSAVWGGLGQMIVWGGWNGTSFLGNGAKYDPSSNTWASMSTTNDPSPRGDHVAVYFGSTYGYMVVWGGQGSGGPVAAGKRYREGLNDWVNMSSTGEPSARYNHSGILANTTYQHDRKVLVWGGNDGSNNLITGGAYQPERDEWSTITASGAPTSRQAHTAVWTGMTMVVWGGESSSGLLRSGGVFDHFNNVWRSTTTSGAPTARSEHSAVWRPDPASSLTGQMIVWGGNDGGYCADGSRYTPLADYVLYAGTNWEETIPGAVEYDLVRAHLAWLNDYSSSVTLSCISAPGSCAFSANPLTPSYTGTNFADIDFSVSSTASLGDQSIEIRATDGSYVRDYDVTLVVRDFGFSCSPATVTAQPGGSAQTTCTLSSLNDFNDAVDLYCSSANPSCSFSANPATPPAGGSTDVVVTFNVAAPTTPGTYTVELYGAYHNAYRFDYVDVVVVTNGTLQGHVDHVPSLSYAGGTTVAAYTSPANVLVASTTTDGNGDWSLNVPADTYRIQASRTGFLWSQATRTLSSGQTLTLPDLTLHGGDVDGNGVINIVDVSTIATLFGGSDPTADLNTDGTVNIIDLAAAASSFGDTAPTPW